VKTYCTHGVLLAVCREKHGPYTWTWRDPLRPIETDDEPFTSGPRLKASGAPVGCVLLLLAVAAGVVAGYLLGVTR